MPLFLVKHSVPEVRREASPESWSLSEEGRRRAESAAVHLVAHRPTRLVSSKEPKAIETAEVIGRRVGLEVELREGLHEHVLSGEWFEDQATFDQAVARFFERPDERVLGKETATEAARRFSAALHEVLAGSTHDSVVVVSHGRVMSLFAAPRFGEETTRFWSRLGFPSLIALGLPGLEPIGIVERFI